MFDPLGRVMMLGLAGMRGCTERNMISSSSNLSGPGARTAILEIPAAGLFSPHIVSLTARKREETPNILLMLYAAKYDRAIIDPSSDDNKESWRAIVSCDRRVG